MAANHKGKNKTPTKKELVEALKAYFQHDSFRGPQLEIIQAILNKKDVIGILPTGTGKSLCYQLPAIFMENMTLVLSPLVALMKDQVDILNARGIPTTSLNSHLTPKQMRERIEEIKEGRFKVLYLAPEKLFAEDFREVFAKLPIDHIAVDEAHCISQWGHDFRPKYKKISQALINLPSQPTLSAFTATASPEVLKDIQRLLPLREPMLFKTSFDRPNLFLDVILYEDKRKVMEIFLEEQLKRPEALGLIYTNTRSEAEAIAQTLEKKGRRVGLYHGGLTKKERSEVQEEFFRDGYQILVATNAFGMGLDKENISFVLHYNMPATLESYYQEIGRGGRGGQPCSCLLLFGLKDVMVNKALGKTRVYFKWRLEQKEAWLEEMVAFAHSRSCFRQIVLGHFGEVSSPCGFCGNCRAKYEERDRSVHAQMILSGVYHTKGHYGKGTLVALMKGKKTPKIKERGLERLSVFGLMNDLQEKEIHLLLMELILRGYLEQRNQGLEERLLITQKGGELLKGKETLLLMEKEKSIID